MITSFPASLASGINDPSAEELVILSDKVVVRKRKSVGDSTQTEGLTHRPGFKLTFIETIIHKISQFI